jgi:hypothetical protein
VEKQYMTHEEVTQLLKDGYDMPRGWATGKGQPEWHNKVRIMWRGMWRRCYDPSHHSYKYYINAIVHDDFRLFSNYLKWIQAQPRFDEFCSTCHEVSWAVDKDIKDSDNRNYFPEYMTLVTKSENSKERNDRCGSPNRGNFKKLRGINIKDGSVIIFDSVLSLYDKGFDPSTIRKCMKGKYTHHKGYKWEYIEEGDIDVR